MAATCLSLCVEACKLQRKIIHRCVCVSMQHMYCICLYSSCLILHVCMCTVQGDCGWPISEFTPGDRRCSWLGRPLHWWFPGGTAEESQSPRSSNNLVVWRQESWRGCTLEHSHTHREIHTHTTGDSVRFLVSTEQLLMFGSINLKECCFCLFTESALGSCTF